MCSPMQWRCPAVEATLTFKSEIQKQINVLSILHIGIGTSIKKKRNLGVAALHNSQVQQCITTAKFVKCLNMKSPSETRQSGKALTPNFWHLHLHLRQATHSETDRLFERHWMQPIWKQLENEHLRKCAVF